jgi:hypothetical protein
LTSNVNGHQGKSCCTLVGAREPIVGFGRDCDACGPSRIGAVMLNHGRGSPKALRQQRTCMENSAMQFRDPMMLGHLLPRLIEAWKNEYRHAILCAEQFFLLLTARSAARDEGNCQTSTARTTADAAQSWWSQVHRCALPPGHP